MPSGYDTSEGLAHLRTALFWLETGDLAQPGRHGATFLRAPDGLYYQVIGVPVLFIGVHGSLLSWHGDWG